MHKDNKGGAASGVSSRNNKGANAKTLAMIT